MTAAPHVYTLTGNLLAERTLEFAAWSPGRTQRAAAESFQVGGKGINVAKMLHRLGTPPTALCFTGGATGAECEAWLHRQAFASRCFATATPTRAGTVVRDRSAAHRETTFLGADSPVDATALLECADFLDTLPAGQVLAFCGSFPGWAEPACEPLRAALLRWLQRGLLLVDTYGPPLLWAASQPVTLIKINADELRTLGAAENEFPSAPRAWVVTDGPGAIRVRDETGRLDTLQPPAIVEVSPTGSGDVLLACIAHARLAKHVPLRDAVAFAIPYAAANAAHPGVADFRLPL
ncbi:MAG: PfkB family carbohydrate kinase [Verrucomicrobiota bacterium]